MLAAWSPLEISLAIVLPAIQLIGLYCAWRALLYTRTAQGATAWVIALVLQPFIAVPLYAIFGRRKFVGYHKARREGDGRLRGMSRELAEALEDFESGSAAAGPRLDTLEALAALNFTARNEVELLVDGDAAFKSMFDGIERAKEYVLVQFFIVRDDRIGRELAERLKQRAADGLRVLFLYDEIGSYSLNRDYIDDLRAAGVEMRAFHSTKGRMNRFQLNFRNHRKVVITDGAVAWTGGLNVGDEYLGRDKHVGPWRDTHVRVAGPAVLGIQLGFLEDWHWATKKIPKLSWKPHLPEAFRDVPAEAPPPEGDAPPVLALPGAHALALPSGPADPQETVELFFLHMINSATERIWIASPYFVPDRTVVQALRLAALRGVDVRILLPSKPDHVLVYLSSFSYLEELLDPGIRVFRYLPGFLHEKVLLLDRDLAAVGSANLDNRSFRLNFELTLVVRDEAFNGKVEAMLERDLERSMELEPGHITDRSLAFRSLVKLARLAAPVQ